MVYGRKKGIGGTMSRMFTFKVRKKMGEMLKQGYTTEDIKKSWVYQDHRSLSKFKRVWILLITNSGDMGSILPKKRRQVI